MIKIENLKQSYNGTPVIKGMNLKIRKGELVFLHSMSTKDSKKGSSPVPIIAGVIALILLGWLFVSWRKKSKS